MVKKNGIGLSVVCMARSSHTDVPIGKNLTGAGEIRLLPDLSTKRTVPWYFLYFNRTYIVVEKLFDETTIYSIFNSFFF